MDAVVKESVYLQVFFDRNPPTDGVILHQKNRPDFPTDFPKER